MNKILLIVVFILSAQSANAAALSKPPNNLGLVGYWSFNDAAGLQARDYSGYGNHGALNNGPTWTAGMLGKALSFDGTDDTVSMPGATALNLSNAITISAWVKLQTGFDNNHKMVVSRYGPSLNWYMSIYLKTAFLSLWIDGVQSFSAGSRTLSAERWHHVVASWDSTTDRYKTYLDGVADVDVDMPGNAITSDSGMFIGTFSGADLLFPGSIDEVRVYNRALSNAEVSRLYASTQATVKGPGSTDGLVGYWPLNDCQRTRATDQSGRGNHGTLNGFSFTGTSSNWVTGDNAKDLCALHFDGTNDYVDAGNGSSLTLTDLTVSFWFKPTVEFNSSTGRKDLLAKFLSYWVILNYPSNDGKITLAVNGGNSVTSTQTSWTAGQWYHFVGTISGTTGTIYIDGIQSATGSLGSAPSVQSYTLQFGGNTTAGTYGNLAMDEVRLYNRALTPTQVKALYAGSTRKTQVSSGSLTAGTSLATGLVGHWTFDGADMTGNGGAGTAKDVSGQANHGALTGGPMRTLGKMGQALSFDGVDDHISVPEISLGTEHSVAAWVKIREVRANGIFSGSFANANYFLLIHSNGNVYYALPGYGYYILAGAWGYPALNQWAHVAVVRSGTTVTYYLNGVAPGGSATLGANTAVSLSLIGNSPNGDNPANAYTWGLIDDARVYNRALTANEVKQLYNLAR